MATATWQCSVVTWKKSPKVNFLVSPWVSEQLRLWLGSLSYWFDHMTSYQVSLNSLRGSRSAEFDPAGSVQKQMPVWGSFAREGSSALTTLKRPAHKSYFRCQRQEDWVHGQKTDIVLEAKMTDNTAWGPGPSLLKVMCLAPLSPCFQTLT